MPKYEGVYRAATGSWYFKVTLGRDPVTGKRRQLTKRGFRSAADAARARRDALDAIEEPTAAVEEMTVDELLDRYLDGIDIDGRLATKTRFDYRRNADAYVRPWLGNRLVHELDAEVLRAWQRDLSGRGGTKNGKPLAPNTVRLARASFAGALKLAIELGLLPSNPLDTVPRPVRRRGIPRHWAPQDARAFLEAQADDRLYPLWAFLLGSGVRIGELVWLRWANVDLEGERVRIVDFATTLGWNVVPSDGKSATAVRTIDLDPGLVQVLRGQRQAQEDERRRFGGEDSDLVFSRPDGTAYHPQYLSKLLAQLAVESNLPRLTAHGLRHTSATLMLDAGVPPKVAAERLGHADPVLFLSLYSHVTPTIQREAARAIGGYLFGHQDDDEVDAPEPGAAIA